MAVANSLAAITEGPAVECTVNGIVSGGNAALEEVVNGA